MKIAVQTRWTLLGLAIALFGIPAVATAERMLSANPQGSAAIIARELGIIALTALLLWIIRTQEQLSLKSIGLDFRAVARSLAWGLGLSLVCFGALIATLSIYSAFGIHYGESAAISRSIPLTTLTVLRAGVSEEVFYRGFAIERLQSLTGSAFIGSVVSLL